MEWRRGAFPLTIALRRHPPLPGECTLENYPDPPSPTAAPAVRRLEGKIERRDLSLLHSERNHTMLILMRLIMWPFSQLLNLMYPCEERLGHTHTRKEGLVKTERRWLST